MIYHALFVIFEKSLKLSSAANYRWCFMFYILPFQSSCTYSCISKIFILDVGVVILDIIA